MYSILSNTVLTFFELNIIHNSMKGFTITEIANKLGITYLAAKQRLLRAGIKPITKEAVYSETALEAIRVVAPVGWPRKPAAPAKKKPKKEI